VRHALAGSPSAFEAEALPFAAPAVDPILPSARSSAEELVDELKNFLEFWLVIHGITGIGTARLQR
jgi:hypothetical protein